MVMCPPLVTKVNLVKTIELLVELALLILSHREKIVHTKKSYSHLSLNAFTCMYTQFECILIDMLSDFVVHI